MVTRSAQSRHQDLSSDYLLELTWPRCLSIITGVFFLLPYPEKGFLLELYNGNANSMVLFGENH